MNLVIKRPRVEGKKHYVVLIDDRGNEYLSGVCNTTLEALQDLRTTLASEKSYSQKIIDFLDESIRNFK